MQRIENEGCRSINLGETIGHLGGRGLSGALAYTGVRAIEYSALRVRLHVNGKPGYRYYISITVSGSDLYDIEMWSQRGESRQCLGITSDLYCDDLQAAVESMYDDAMNATNGGIIPIR